MLDDYLPKRVNQGPWITAYTLDRLRDLESIDFVLPICSLGTPLSECASLGKLVLPPLYSEALTDNLKREIVQRISACFPTWGSQDSGARLRIVELPPVALPPEDRSRDVLAFSVDTAVEEHGPHLPLGTDTLQSYSVLSQLAKDCGAVRLERPLEYGQLTWGLPFGFSIDLTSDLLSRYVAGYINAITRWKSPSAIYVVDVHGSITHRQAIVEGLRRSEFDRWTFRWLHEPLAEFASERGDQHAGGVETALIQRISPELLDAAWWPERIDDLACRQMSFATAVELASDLESFRQHVAEHSLNGIIGDIRNYHLIDADEMFERMLNVARADIEALLAGRWNQSSGANLW